MIKSKKKIVKTICYIFIISCLMYSFMTEKGAVRFSILLYGCPPQSHRFPRHTLRAAPACRFHQNGTNRYRSDFFLRP